MQTNQFIATLAAKVWLVHGADLRVENSKFVWRRVINWIERRDYMPGAGNVDSFASKATETDCLEL